MIRCERGELVAECNECGDTFAAGFTGDFHDFIRDLKDEGWKIEREEGDGADEWLHFCPDCVQ